MSFKDENYSISSIIEIGKSIFDDIKNLISKYIELISLKIKENTKHIAKLAVILTLCCLLALNAFLFFNIFIFYLLNITLPLWGAAIGVVGINIFTLIILLTIAKLIMNKIKHSN